MFCCRKFLLFTGNTHHHCVLSAGFHSSVFSQTNTNRQPSTTHRKLFVNPKNQDKNIKRVYDADGNVVENYEEMGRVEKYSSAREVARQREVSSRPDLPDKSDIKYILPTKTNAQLFVSDRKRKMRAATKNYAVGKRYLPQGYTDLIDQVKGEGQHEVLNKYNSFLDNEPNEDVEGESADSIDDKCGLSRTGETALREWSIDTSKIPRYTKINGWETKNPDLKRLRSLLSRYSSGILKDRNTHDNREDIDSENVEDGTNIHTSEPLEDRSVVLEGRNLILDAMNIANLYPKVMAFSRLKLLADIPFDMNKDLDLFHVPYQYIKVWSDLKTPPGMVAVFSQNEIEESINRRISNGNPISSFPITLILDNIRSPDNLGAIYRLAASMGCKKIISMKGCADVWSRKALRSGAGAHFRVPMVSKVEWFDIHNHIDLSSTQVLLADMESSAKCNWRLSGDESSDMINHQVEQSRNRAKNYVTDEDEYYNEIERLNAESLEFHTTKDITDLSDISDSNIYHDMSYRELELMQSYADLPRPNPISCDDISRFHQHFGKMEVCLVLGGESCGVSASALKFMHCNRGDQVSIDLSYDMESLNVVSAASIILHNVRSAFKQEGSGSITHECSEKTD